MAYNRLQLPHSETTHVNVTVLKSVRLKLVRRAAFAVLLAGAGAGARAAWGQVVAGAGGLTAIELQPNQSRSVEILGEPGTLQVVEVHLRGGLLGLQSPETVRRLLDLGSEGDFLFAVEIPESGKSSVEITSAERLRNASLTIGAAPRTLSREQQQHLRAAGIAFALADSARRRQPHAPDVATALSLYEDAARDALAAGEPSLASWALTQKGRFLLYGKSSYTETRKLLERTAALLAADDHAVAALLYKTLSSCEYYLGDLPQSVADGERALALYRQTGDRYWQGVVLGNLIAGYGEEGRDEQAAASAQEALADAESTEDPAGVVFDLTELAALYKREGALELAFQSFREAEVWSADIRYAPLVQAEIEAALGQFYLDLGLWPEAEEQLRRCLKHAPANSAASLEARGALARALDQRGELRVSLAEHDAAIEAARNAKLPREEAALLLGRSATLLRAHRPQPALRDAEVAGHLAETADSPSLRIQAALARGAACLLACTHPAESAVIYQQALGAIEAGGEREQEAAAHAGLARVHAADANYAGALDESSRAVDLLERSRASLLSHDLAANYFLEGRDWYALATDAALELDRLQREARPRDSQLRERAFEFSERARARAMLDALQEPLAALPDVHAPGVHAPDGGSAGLERRMAANRFRIEARKAELLADSDPAKAAQALKSLYRESDALEAERKSLLATETHRDLHQIATVGALQRGLLDAHSALLSFSAGVHGTHRWLITRTSMRVDALPSFEELARSLGPLRQLLQQRLEQPAGGEDAAAYAVRLHSSERDRELGLTRAGALLLPPFPPAIHRLYIVADGPLGTVPWNALRTTCGGRACYSLERFTISLEPSASVALSLAENPPRPHSSGALVVSDAVPGDRESGPRWRELGPLPGSAREAAAIARLLPARNLRSLREADATPLNLEKALQSRVRFLHLAAHTLLVAGHPELSGIALSAGVRQGRENPSVLWLHDIPRLSAPPLVVLSGCTTQGAGLAGEEISTLTQAFFLAGAQEVIASNWPVDDEATVTLMEHFYGNLLGVGATAGGSVAGRMPAAEALRLAELRMLAEGADLADWAAFLIDGVPSHSRPGVKD